MMNNYRNEVIELAKDLCQKYNFVFQNEKNNFSYNGKVEIDILSKTRNLSLKVKGSIFSLNNKNIFTENLVTLFHETEHIKQFYNIQTNDVLQATAYNYLSIQNNIEYYYQNYSEHLLEIEAEKYGVISAYFYIEENHPELNAFQCIKEYINNHIKQNDIRYINHNFENCSSIEEIANCFSEIYENAFTTSRSFVSLSRQYEKIYIDNSCFKKLIDENIIYAMFHELGKENVLNMMKLLRTGLEQDKLMGAYILEKHPDYRDFFANEEVKNLYLECYTQAFLKFKTNHDDHIYFGNSYHKEFLQLVETAKKSKEAVQNNKFDENDDYDER